LSTFVPWLGRGVHGSPLSDSSPPLWATEVAIGAAGNLQISWGSASGLSGRLGSAPCH